MCRNVGSIDRVMNFAQRLDQVSESKTQRVQLEAARLRRQGFDVVDLSAGEPDFSTPAHVKASGISAIKEDFTKYTANAGIRELKQAIAERYLVDYGIDYKEEETIVCAGGKQALFNAAMALFEAGDEVITHVPGWPTIAEQIKLTGAEPILVRTYPEDRFQLKADDVLGAMSARTKAIILNSPCNPTGALISPETLQTIAEQTAAQNVWLILDLCYERLIYQPEGQFLPSLLNKVARDRSVLVGSLSKTYAMTGWRCGWALGPASLIRAVNAIQSHSTSNTCSITQRAAVSALTESQECVNAMLSEYRARRDMSMEWFQGESMFRVVQPAGAFYLFPDISSALRIEGPRTSLEFADRLLSEAHVAVTAGEAFDAPGFLRLSFATSMERLKEGFGRLRRFVESLR